jgi:hypothetical protein
MDKPIVRPVFRIPLPHDRCGEIRAGAVIDTMPPLPPSAAVVLEVGAGWWCRHTELERISSVLGTVAHISVTGTDLRRGGADGQNGVVTGLGGIADMLGQLIASPPLFEIA